MTDLTAQHIGETGNRVGRFFNWIWNGLVAMAEASPRAQAIRKLNAISDAELEARGVTREEVIRRIFADRLYA